jgi:membrane protease YdiL (CAAX protease family)
VSRIIPISVIAVGAVAEAITISSEHPIPYLGLGHFLQQDWLNGAVFLGGEIGLMAVERELRSRVDARDFSRFPYLSNRSIYQATGMGPEAFAFDGYASLARLSLFNLRLYDFFTAYRKFHDDSAQASTVPLTQDNVLSLCSSPFTPRHVLNPWVWGPILIAGTAAFIGASGNRSLARSNQIVLFDHTFTPGQAFFAHGAVQAFRYTTVAVGEEVFFRGALQTELTEAFSPTFALATSSILFGLWHIPHNGPSGGLAAMIAGLYLGYRYQASGYDLGEVIALHFWLDWVVSTVEFASNPRNGQFVYRISWAP